MRMLIFSELFYPHGGGAELATWLYSKLLAEEGFKITIITKQFPGEPSTELLNNEVIISRLPMRMIGSRYDTLINVGVLASNFINKLITKNDVIYIPCGWYSAIPIAKIHKKPVIVHMHTYPIACSTSLMYDFVKQQVRPSSRKSFILHELIERRRNIISTVTSSLINELMGRYYNKLGMLADAIIFVSNTQAKLTLSKVPQIERKSYVIYNPIPDVPLVKAESKGIGYFGGRRFIKGFHVVMQALKNLRCPSSVEIYMTMVADKHMIKRTDNKILINFLPKLDIISFLNLMKKLFVIVVPSLWPETFSYTVVESMLYGKLVIASNVGAIPEIIDGVAPGIRLIEPGDYKGIADGLTSFLTLRVEDANEIGIKNRERILRKFDNKKTIKSFIQVLNKIV